MPRKRCRQLGARRPDFKAFRPNYPITHAQPEDGSSRIMHRFPNLRTRPSLVVRAHSGQPRVDDERCGCGCGARRICEAGLGRQGEARGGCCRGRSGRAADPRGSDAPSPAVPGEASSSCGRGASLCDLSLSQSGTAARVQPERAAVPRAAGARLRGVLAAAQRGLLNVVCRPVDQHPVDQHPVDQRPVDQRRDSRQQRDLVIPQRGLSHPVRALGGPCAALGPRDPLVAPGGGAVATAQASEEAEAAGRAARLGHGRWGRHGQWGRWGRRGRRGGLARGSAWPRAR